MSISNDENDPKSHIINSITLIDQNQNNPENQTESSSSNLQQNEKAINLHDKFNHIKLNATLSEPINDHQIRPEVSNRIHSENEFTTVKKRLSKKRSTSVTRNRRKVRENDIFDDPIRSRKSRNLDDQYLYNQQNQILQFQFLQLMQMRKASEEQFNMHMMQQAALLQMTQPILRQSKKRKSRNKK